MDNRVPGSQWEGTELADQWVAFDFHLNMLNSGSYSVVTRIPASRSSLLVSFQGGLSLLPCMAISV